jgi:O-antigen/teichoic acid export membrane protein
VRTRVTFGAVARTAIIAAAALLSGLGSYVLLIVVAKNTSTVDYADFAVFWSLAVVVGLGVFYPLEQETARETAGLPVERKGGFAQIVLAASAGCALLLGLLSLVFLTPSGVDYLGSPLLVVALAISFVGYAAQFPVRGFLSGAGRTTSYSAVVALEGLLRVVLPVALVLVGVTGSFWFACVIGVAAGLSVVPRLLGRDRSWLGRDRPPVGLFLSRFGRLIVAALSIQLLLNSGVLVAKALSGPSGEVLAAQILTAISIARIPIFGYQVLQILYIPRLSTEWKGGRFTDARATVLFAVGAAAAIGVVIVAGMLIFGPWATALLFGPKLVLSSSGILLVSVGVALFLVALVASDGALAIGRHSLVLRSWLVALVAVIPVIVLVDGTLLRSTLPLVVGSSFAALQLLIGLAAGLTRNHRKGPEC